jgi:hypothetical protein
MAMARCFHNKRAGFAYSFSQQAKKKLFLSSLLIAFSVSEK